MGYNGCFASVDEDSRIICRSRTAGNRAVLNILGGFVLGRLLLPLGGYCRPFFYGFDYLSNVFDCFSN